MKLDEQHFRSVAEQIESEAVNMKNSSDNPGRLNYHLNKIQNLINELRNHSDESRSNS